jgi:hypothetical protein
LRSVSGAHSSAEARFAIDRVKAANALAFFLLDALPYLLGLSDR